jgi:hypothetical protein
VTLPHPGRRGLPLSFGEREDRAPVDPSSQRSASRMLAPQNAFGSDETVDAIDAALDAASLAGLQVVITSCCIAERMWSAIFGPCRWSPRLWRMGPPGHATSERPLLRGAQRARRRAGRRHPESRLCDGALARDLLVPDSLDAPSVIFTKAGRAGRLFVDMRLRAACCLREGVVAR